MFEEERFTTAMLGRANCSLKPDKKLLNSKFEQYKYTSGREHEITYRTLKHKPHRTKPPDSDFSYQMSRTSCLFNHLIVPPKGGEYYYISHNGEEHNYILVDATTDTELARLQNQEKLIFNISAIWIGSETLALCIGTHLYLLSVSSTSVKQTSEQKLDFQCLLLGSFKRDETIHLVLCYRTDNVFVHQVVKQNDSGKFEVTTSIRQSGIARFVAVRGDMLTMISEGKLLVPQPQPEEPEQPAEVPVPVPREREEEKNYTWTQTLEDVDVSIELPSGILKSDLIIEIGHDSLEVRTKGGQELFKSKLFSKVEPKESTWHMSSDKKRVEVVLTKYQEAHNWAYLVDTPHYDPAGNLLGEISDLSEEELRGMMRRMESLNEYTSDKVDKSPLYTPHPDLEECDELDGQQVLLSSFSLDPAKQLSLVELSPGTLLFSDSDRGFVVSHSVDACYYEVESEASPPWLHASTFHAFNMVQATKTQKKYIVTDPDRKYAAIVDITRHVYIYSSAGGAATHGKLLVMTLDNSDDSEILGVFPRTESIVLLTEKYLITIKFSL
ncbi:hypothetical protein ACHWQZ_G006291 [Mnemiopsis leidyi]